MDGVRNWTDISLFGGLYILNRIQVDTLAAKWCNNNITLKFYLQNIFLGIIFIEKAECECFTCPYPYSFIKSLNNFSAYNYGGINSLKIDSGGFFNSFQSYEQF
jgi:hypothetical protein